MSNYTLAKKDEGKGRGNSKGKGPDPGRALLASSKRSKGTFRRRSEARVRQQKEGTGTEDPEAYTGFRHESRFNRETQSIPEASG